MKKLINIIGFIAWTSFVGAIFFVAGVVYKERNPDKDAFDLLPSLTHQVKIIQKRAGCTMIDAEVGPEFKLMVNAAVKREKCQQANDWAIDNMPKGKK